MPPLKTLGIDPGLKKGLAWAIYDSETDELVVGMLKPKSDLPLCADYAQQVGSLLESYGPDAVGVETQHIRRLPQHALPQDRQKLLGMIYSQAASALDLAAVRGACIATVSASGIPVIELEPAVIKSAICGNGRASKEQVRRMVERLFGARMVLIRSPREKHVLREDEADAAASAVAAQRRQ